MELDEDKSLILLALPRDSNCFRRERANTLLAQCPNRGITGRGSGRGQAQIGGELCAPDVLAIAYISTAHHDSPLAADLL
jgi:hypothetical protein